MVHRKVEGLNPLTKKVFKGVLILELAGLVGVYLLYHKIDSSRDFRHAVNRRFPSILEVYYKSNEWAGVQGKREADAQAWSTKTDYFVDFLKTSLLTCQRSLPLQSSVRSQAGLPGLYDPCSRENKYLKILYQFRGALHQVTSADTELLRIPKQSHKMDVDS